MLSHIIYNNGIKGNGKKPPRLIPSVQPDDIQGWVVGNPSVTGQLRAERSGKGKGRVYTLTYMATDHAGNQSTCVTTITVPHDKGK